MTEWFQSWFNDDYLVLYPHRNAAEAAQLVSLIGQFTGWSRGLAGARRGVRAGAARGGARGRGAAADRARPFECRCCAVRVR